MEQPNPPAPPDPAPPDPGVPYPVPDPGEPYPVPDPHRAGIPETTETKGEISAYGTARTLARELGYDGAAALLDETLDEEAHADNLLTKIAEGGIFRSGVNEQAATRS